MSDTQCPAGMAAIWLCFADSIPPITDTEVDPAMVRECAYNIWKRYGNQDEVTLSSGL